MSASPPDESDALLEVRELVKHYPVRRGLMQRRAGTVHAVDGVSFQVRRGETLGLVGESGCGKTTVARTVVRLLEPTSGTVRFGGRNVHEVEGAELRSLRARLQMVFQDPYSSLNPRRTVGDSIAEPLLEHDATGRDEREARVAELMRLVGLDPALRARYPHEFSGGQRQRVGIARALALEPELVVCDEPIAALDVSIQGQIVNLLKDVQARMGLAYLFISHDLRMVRHLCDRVAVMYLGKIVESGPVDDVYGSPRHPYTRALLGSIARTPGGEAGEGRRPLEGELPSPEEPPSGCRFRTRCPVVESRCAEDEPALRAVGEGHSAACVLVG